jgi:peptidylprolyl isomerase domain and WD repeat-containing protein 1
MHRDVVTHVAVSSADFFMTGSCDGKFTPLLPLAELDFFFEEIIFVELSVLLFAEADHRLCPDNPAGHLKFWKKKGLGIEFVKHFRSHLGPIKGLTVSPSS